MLEQYRPEDFKDVARFARKLDNFFYVKLIIKAHTKGRLPGECHVWREDGRIVAFSAIAYLNSEDAWLWGMRVDPAFQNHGIASRFARAQFKVVKAAGRTWAGLNTLHRNKPKATYRVMEKLGFRLEDVQCEDIFWRRPKGVARPRLRRFPRMLSHYRRLGRRTVFYDNNGWFNCRLLPARAGWLNCHGRLLDGIPVTVIPRQFTSSRGGRRRMLSINLFDRPPDFGVFVPRLLALMPKRGHMVANYPVEWSREFRRAAKAAIPRLRPNHGCWFSAWRIYGKELK
jgi:GNAT superfamily N-acetyltransferase